jgi:hypothetical protein
MLYRNHREYDLPQKNPNLGPLRSWLRGETGDESLREWLGAMYN